MRSSILNQIVINHPELSNKERFTIIKQAYLSVLYYDDRWHFFHEEEQGDILRFSPEYSEKIVKWLDDNNIKHSDPEEWEENIPMVVNNMEFFADYFHLISEALVENCLIIDDKKPISSMSAIIDRLSHTTFLNFKFSTSLPECGEEVVLSDVTTNRAFYSGMRYQFKEMKKYQDSKDGKDKVS